MCTTHVRMRHVIGTRRVSQRFKGTAFPDDRTARAGRTYDLNLSLQSLQCSNAAGNMLQVSLRSPAVDAMYEQMVRILAGTGSRD